MIDFGYSPNKSRVIDLDNADFTIRELLLKEVPSFKRCIGCGGCASTCSSRQHTDFSILKCNMLFRHGQYHNLKKELDKCMLCGNCLLVCPRNLNTRGMIISMRTLLSQLLKD